LNSAGSGADPAHDVAELAGLFRRDVVDEMHIDLDSRAEAAPETIDDVARAAPVETRIVVSD